MTKQDSIQYNKLILKIIPISIMAIGSFFLLWLVFTKIPLDEVLVDLSKANLFWVFVGFCCISCSIWLRSVRWRLLLKFQITSQQSFYTVSIGTLLNQIPLRAGDFVRASLVSNQNVPFVTGLTSIIVENLQDILLIVVLLTLSFSQLESIPIEVVYVSQIFGCIIIIAFLTLFLLTRVPQYGYSLVSKLSGTHILIEKLKLNNRFTEILRGFEPITNELLLLQSVFWTIGLWLFNIMTFFFLAQAFNLRYDNLVQWSILSVMLISLGVAIPVSVAGIGPYQVAVIISGNALGIDMLDSVVIGITIHAVSVFTFLFWGIISLPMLGMSFGGIIGIIRQKTV